MNKHHKINYIEFPACDIAATQTFFKAVFGWTFQDFGPDYTTFADDGLSCGFFKSDLAATTENGSALAVFYSDSLEETFEMVEANHGAIVKPIFSFPGGRRFQFTEPSGNEFAVWTNVDTDGKEIACH